MQPLTLRAVGCWIWSPRWATFAAILVGAGACEGFADQGQPVLTPYGRSLGIALTQVDTAGHYGLSDLTHTGDDNSRLYWAVPEQQRTLVQIDLGSPGSPKVAPRPRPIVGIDEAYDTESVTALGHGLFALGTETQVNKRPWDTIFIVAGVNPHDVNRGPLSVIDAIHMPYSLWPNFVARRNEGLEGLCAVDNLLLASSESVGRTDLGQRFAPLGRYDMERQQWSPYAVALTMPTGRLSAVQCRINAAHPEHIELIAIERHYGVGRILHAWLPRTLPADACQEPLLIFPEVLADLASSMAPLANFEGIDWTPDGGLLLITDNHMGFVRGPTYLLKFPKPL